MIRKISLLALITILLLCGCSTPFGAQDDPRDYTETGFIPATPGNYDSLDTAIYVGSDKDQKTIRFYNLETGRFYTLNFDGATTYQDKYAQPLALDQVRRGAVVDISFMHARKRLNSLQVNGEAFAFTDVEDLLVPADSRQLFLMGENYTMDQKAVILTADGPGEAMDLNVVDKLMVCGVGHTVYSISVQNSHGYLRLENDEHFVGGFIEIGDNRVYQISRDMLLAVPVGTYDVTVSNKGSAGTTQVNVSKGQEVSIDVSPWVSKPKYGKVLFTSTPSDAEIFIDGNKIERGKDTELSYGIHLMVAQADGYNTVKRYIRVAQEMAQLNVTLDKGSSSSSNAASDSSPVQATPTLTPTLSPTPTPEESASENNSGNAASENEPGRNDAPAEDGGGSGYDDARVSGDEDGGGNNSNNNAITPGEYRVYIDAPEGVEVYKDGAYIGITPLFFKKAQGTCIVTLRKEGYRTRSYTITMDAEEKDVNYSFSELLPIE